MKSTATENPDILDLASPRGIKVMHDAFGQTRQSLPRMTGLGFEASGVDDSGQEPKISIEGYQIHELIGVGGMGSVFRATELSTQRIVAVKTLRPGAFGRPEYRERFEREIQLGAALDHSAIVRIYSSGLYHQRYYYVMEYIDGQKLDDYARRRQLSEHEALRLIGGILEGVGYAHERGVLHRDIKPSNILVTDCDEPRILDFGLAAEAGESTHCAAGTIDYMPPERFASPPSDSGARGDVYAIAVIAYELLCGCHPYEIGNDFDQVRQTLRDSTPRQPRDMNPRVGSDLNAIIMKGLAKDPSVRYASASAFREDVTRYLAGDPVTARPLTAPYYLVNRIRKYRLATTAILVAFLVVAGLLTNAYFEVSAARIVAVREAEAQRRTNYLLSIRYAMSELEAGNSRQAEKLLDGCPDDLRGWEWHRLRYIIEDGAQPESRTAGGRKMVQSGRESAVTVVLPELEFGFVPIAGSFAPRSGRTAAADATRIVVIDDEGALVELAGHGPISWTQDGRLISTEHDRDTYRLIVHSANLASRETAFESELQIDHVISAYDKIAVALADGSVTSIDASTYRVISTCYRVGQFGAIAFNPSATRFVTVGKGISIWDPVAGVPVVNIDAGRRFLVSAAFSSDGSELIVEDMAGQVMVYPTR